MAITTNTIFNHPIPKTLTQYPQFFNPKLPLWDHLLNQKYTREYIQEEVDRMGDVEEAYTSLIQSLITFNSIDIYHPETGEILWSINTTTGEEEP